MHSVQEGMWDPRPPSKNASPLPPPPLSNLRLAHVTTATPVKRITFYKSGDSQFGGIRMAVHKRSFKCFDALLDDLSQKVPLPFGVRTVTTPRGIHTIKHLEQLQDGGCYLCSDRRQAKPVNMELASKRPGIWYHHSRRPHRPETSSATPPGHLPYRQRRILLVKNSEPGMRRSVVMSRRSTRSLRAFLDEVSEVMQFHVRKLYTAEGRRIDSVQSLMTCPGVLMCVGREAFSPTLVNFIRKSSEEKLPGLGPRTPGNGARSPATQGARSPPHGAQSRASECSEGHESKKNVNFGLETKKSIIHPRSDSSNRSTRFSLSSEKSYGNGVSAYCQSSPAIMNEDIEKRVLVNKDGSLSVEMRVRFRLHNDETLQWSTQIKKSPSLTNECCPLSQAQPNYLQQGQSESCSDPDCTSFDPEGVDYSSQPLQHASEGNRCPCCYQRPEQQYDLWENPAHSHKYPPVPPPHTSRHTHSSSSSSSCNSRKVVRCRARLSNCARGSGSKQSQLVQEEMCVTEQVERVEVEQDGDSHVKVCRVRRCCSHSEVVDMDSNLRPLSQKSVGAEGERPLSAVSSSSHVLQSLKEDQDDDLPPSTSQCCHINEPPPSSAEHNKHEEGEERGSRAASAASSCHCGAATSHSTAEAEEMDRAPSSRMSEGAAGDEDEEIKRVASGLSGHTGVSAGSLQSRASSVCPNCGGCKRGINADSNSRASQRSSRSHQPSPKPATPLSNQENTNNSSDDGSDASAVSTQSNKTNLTNHGSISAKSHVMEGRASSATTSNHEAAGAPRTTSASSHRSSRSHKSGCNGSTGVTTEKDEERSPSTISALSHRSAKSSKSHKSNCSSTAEVATNIRTREETEGEGVVERAFSSLSAKSGASAKTIASIRSIKAAPPTENTVLEEDDTNKRSPSALSFKSNASDRPDSVLSAKSNVSAKSGTSHRSTCSHCVRAVSTGAKAADTPVIEATGQEEEMEAEERAASVRSAKSSLSAKSYVSRKSTKASERSLSPRFEAGGNGEERATSQTSSRSVKSSKSCKSVCNGNEVTASPSVRVAKETENEMAEEIGDNTEGSENAEVQPASVLSGKSASSANCDTSSRVASPAEGTAKTEVDSTEDRAPSATSGKSHKSSKSQKSNRTAASPSPNEADLPSIETNGEEEENENQEPVKSNSSVRSRTSHDLKSLSPSPNAVTIKTPEGVDEEGNEITVRAPSAASAKSVKSNVSSASSQKSNNNRTADIAVIEPDTDEKVAQDNAPQSKSSKSCHGQTLLPGRTRSPRTHSPRAPAATSSRPQSPEQQLLPGHGAGETRGPSALSVHSKTSAKSGRFKCCCGAAKKEKEGKEKGDNEEIKSESSSTKRRRRESGGTEQPLSRNSSGSVSLGLPEDQQTADSDSGKSSVSFYIYTESKGRVKTATPNVPKSTEHEFMNEDVERTGSTFSHNPPAIDIPTIETTGGSEDKSEGGEEQKTERVKSSRSQKSSCNCRVKAAVKMLDNKPEEQQTRTSTSAKVRSKSPASASAAGDSANNDSDNQAVSRPASRAKEKEDVADSRVARVLSKTPCCLKPESAASAQSSSKTKASKESKGEDVRSNAGSNRSSSSPKKEKCMKCSSPCPSHSSTQCNQVETCSKSTLSHSLSAADLLKETMAVARSHSRQTKASKASSKKSGSRNQRDREQELDLTPTYLPNVSPNEVVSDWLRSIPDNSSMLALGDELNGEEEEEEEQEKVVQEEPGEEVEVEKEEEAPGDEKADEEEKVEAEEEDEKEEEADCDAAEEEKSSDPAPGEAARATPRSNTLLLGGEFVPRNWHSSAAVMKVLLSSSLGRCHSMPEVSPVYGRRLSTSARGLLDCLAQLQLVDPALSPGCNQQKGCNQQYEDIMAILQSLWLTEPRDIKAKDSKDTGTEQVTPPRSSSGVGTGSGGSGKENGNKGGDEVEQNKTKETESLHEDEGAEKVVVEEEAEEEGNAESPHKETDIAEEPVQREVPPSLDGPKALENPSSSDKSSGNDSSKSPTDNEREMLEDSSSGTPPTGLRAPLSKRLSQDPDPVWVLHLLKKLEKQFMNHYVNAMAEFKVRWDLDDSLILDTMISELREEVSRRIQSSIVREMRKIQSRAGRCGRSPRPPQGGNLSRESTTTEKRRRMLKVMKNQSVKTGDSLSDGEMTGEFSDQRSEDEYCPCEACVRKKMAARPLKTNPLAAEAPVMMEFDLLKILQLKKSPSPAPAAAPPPVEGEGDGVVVDEEGRNLGVVQEEEEEDETKEDIKADVVLEETIPEEEEEEEGAEEEENSVGDEKEEEGNETGEEETSDNVEEEEEEPARCQCQCATNEEESDAAEGEDAEETGDNTGEEETADDEEGAGESEKETVKEATTGEGETTENGEGEEEECEEEEEEEEGRESGEEASGETEDDNAAKNEANEESSAVDGNVSASAEDEEGEDEEDGDEGTAEGEPHEDEQGGESEERASLQGQGVTEGEEADAEDSDTDKRPSDTSADESGHEETKESGGDGEEVVEDAVEEFKPEEEEEEEGEVDTNEREDGALLHQFTRTSVESQPGSLEDIITTDSPQNPVISIEVPKMAAGVSSGGGTSQRRSRSPARVKRRKPKESDVELDDC